MNDGHRTILKLPNIVKKGGSLKMRRSQCWTGQCRKDLTETSGEKNRCEDHRIDEAKALNMIRKVC